MFDPIFNGSMPAIVSGQNTNRQIFYSSYLTKWSRVEIPDKGSVPRDNGAILCMKPELSAIDRNNFIVPIWMI